MSLTRPDLDAQPSYVPGRSQPDTIKLASNEVPYGPLPGVPEAIAEANALCHRYPDMAASALRSALATRYGVANDQVVTGCGSVALAEALVRAACHDGDEVLYSWRSFEAYPILTATAGATSVRVPNRPDHGHDLPAMAAAITSRTRVIFICNPNNPTGTALRDDALAEFLDRVGPDLLVVIDEAYREFVTDPRVPDGLRYLDRPNVVVLRTFSKAWGLAGLRVGYLIAAPRVAAAVAKVVTPFSTSMPAQAAALAALAAADEMAARVARIVAQRERVHAALLALAPVPESQANFLWLPLREHSTEFATASEEAGVIVRAFANEGVRVTIGTPEENDAFLSIAARLLGAPTAAIARRP